MTAGDSTRFSSHHYSRGAVPQPTKPTVQEQLFNLERVFPSARRHRKAFNALGCQYVFANRISIGQSDYWVVLVRFGEVLETIFGFTREIVGVYCDYKDLQIRTIENFAAIRGRLPRQVTPDTCFVHSPDERLLAKLDDWSTPRLLLLPLPALPDRADESAPIMLELIRQRIYTRDLYSETTPVSGERFFGRRRLIQALLDDVYQRRVVGLFGLRKSGKTSTLKELARHLQHEREPACVFILRDLETLPSLPADVVSPLIEDLRTDLVEELRARNLRNHDLASLDPSYDLLDFRRAMQTTLRAVRDQPVQIVFALDEIEYLCPPDRSKLEVATAQSVPQFFGVLRSLAQETPNFSFLLSGLTSAVLEDGMLYGRPNPLFSWAKPYFIRPFDRAESRELLVSLGHRMGIAWESGAIEEAYARTGGHPYLLRSLASTVVSRLPIKVETRHVTRHTVMAVLPMWQQGVAANFDEILNHVERYYPDESFLLQLLVDDSAAFYEWIEDDPRSVDHLMKLGLLGQDDAGRFIASGMLRRRARK